jgi:RHS repeat-associated protein
MLSESKPSEFLPHFFGEGLPDFEGSYYFNARWYDADTGRFITEDPIRDGLLWYAYANNNPMKFTDPTGLAPRNKSSEEREKYKASISSATLENVPTELPYSGNTDGKLKPDCADMVVTLANDAMEKATGEKDFYKKLNRNGTPLKEIVDIHSSDFRDGENFTFYRNADGEIEKDFSFAGVEVGTIGVFDNHVITVIGFEKDGTTMITMQGHTGKDNPTTRDKIVSQHDLDSYKGTFLGWGEIGKDSASFKNKQEKNETRKNFDDPFDDK